MDILIEDDEEWRLENICKWQNTREVCLKLSCGGLGNLLRRHVGGSKCSNSEESWKLFLLE